MCLLTSLYVYGCVQAESPFPSFSSSLSFSPGSAEETVSSPPPPSKVDMFPKSSEDDPVSQAIAKMIEPDDEVMMMS